MARRILTQQQSLNFLQICHPASNSLQLPSLVPDWSVTLPFDLPIWNQWSACAWISAYAHVKGDRLEACGIVSGSVDSVTTLYNSNDNEIGATVLRNLRRVKPALYETKQTSQEWQNKPRNYGLLFTNNQISDFYTQPMTFLTLEQYVTFLEMIWSSNDTIIHLSGNTREGELISRFLSACYHVCNGRAFFTTQCGYIGLGPADIVKGDIICVLLGSPNPIALRPVHRSNKEQTWKVVGPVLVPGLMRGKSIYRNRLPGHYEPKAVGQDRIDPKPIDGSDYAIHDTKKNIFTFDPTAILEEANIKVEKYERYPHILKVLPGTLRAAGISLENFVIV